MRNGRQKIGGRSVISEGLTDVYVLIDIAGTENEASAQLKGIAAQTMLPVSGGAGSGACDGVVAAQQVEQGCPSETRRAICLSLFVNQKWKSDSTLGAESLRIVQVTKPYGGQARPFVEESLLVFAQLRDVLAAKDSAVVAEERNHRRSAGP